MEEGKVVRIITSCLIPLHSNDELHIHLRKKYPNIGSQECSECVSEEMIPFIWDHLECDSMKICDIVSCIREISSDTRTNHDTYCPCPHVVNHISTLCKKQNSNSYQGSHHATKFRKFLELGILRDTEKHSCDMEDIIAYKIDTRNMEKYGNCWILKIDSCEPICSNKEHRTHNQARYELYAKCEPEEVFCFSIFLFDEVFWEKIIQALCTSKIIEHCE
jgi:hypothetical protein